MIARASARRVFVMALATTALVGIAGCAKPKPPTVVPKDAKVLALDTDAVTVELRVEMTNPNGFALNVRHIAARVKVEDFEVGTMDVPHAVSLPANVPTLVAVPMRIRWDGATGLARIAAKGRDVNFIVDGLVGIGSEKINVDVPYSQSGTITQKQLQDAAVRSIQRQLQPLLPPIGR